MLDKRATENIVAVLYLSFLNLEIVIDLHLIFPVKGLYCFVITMKSSI